VTGPYETVVVVDPPLSGTLNINTLSYTANQFPHTQPYFGGTDAGISLWALADTTAGYKFDHWSAGNHTFSDPDSTFAYLNLTAADTIIAHFSKASSPAFEPGNRPTPSIAAYPTLFDETLQVNFTLPEKSKIELKLFDLLGNQVAENLVQASVGNGSVQFDLGERHLPPGVYFLKCQAGDFEQTIKLIRAK
jgi:hypothetical protein